jgi:hypothetical protein
MYEVKQASIARAIDVLRNAPMTAAQFALKMWPDREYKSDSRASQGGHILLRRLSELGYLERIGDLWMIRRVSAGFSEGSAAGPVDHLIDRPVDHLTARPVDHLLNGSANGSTEGQADRLRLRELVGLADRPVLSVSHDAVYGNLSIRGMSVDSCIAEACAFAVLQGRSINVYPPDGPMLVGLQPVEAARVLRLRWQQSGQPPELPYRGGSAWIIGDDGIIAARGCWKPAGAGPQWQVHEEPIENRIARQRAEAGLGPAIQNGARR